MRPGVIFDLDQTLVDTSTLELHRKQGRWQEIYSKIPSLISFTGIDELLALLAEKSIATIIITTSPSTYCSKIVSNFKWKVTGSICYHDVRPDIKPHPKAFNKAIADYNLDVSKTISVGDRDIDILASNAAGIPAIACTWASPDAKALLSTNPKWIARNSKQMISLIMDFHSI